MIPTLTQKLLGVHHLWAHQLPPEAPGLLTLPGFWFNVTVLHLFAQTPTRLQLWKLHSPRVLGLSLTPHFPLLVSPDALLLPRPPSIPERPPVP